MINKNNDVYWSLLGYSIVIIIFLIITFWPWKSLITVHKSPTPTPSDTYARDEIYEDYREGRLEYKE